MNWAWIHSFVLSINCPFILCQANIADFGDNQWVTCFQDSAEILLGQNSSYLGQLKDSVSFFFLPASHSYSFFPMLSIRVVHESVALRIGLKTVWGAAHCVSIGVLFVVRLWNRHSSPRIFNKVLLSHGVLYIKRQKLCSFKMFCL